MVTAYHATFSCTQYFVLLPLQDLVTIEALTAQEENAESDKLIESLQNGVGGVVNTRMCYMCFDDVDEASNPLVGGVHCAALMQYVNYFYCLCTCVMLYYKRLHTIRRR